MKNKLQLVTAFLCGAIFFSGVSYAADTFLKAHPLKNYDRILINGEEAKFTDPVVTINGKLYLPMREFTQNAGYTISTGREVIMNQFKELPQSITKNGITLTINSISFNDNQTSVNITIKNETNKNIKFSGAGITGNSNVKDKKNYSSGALKSYIPAGNGVYIVEKFIDKEILPNNEVTGDVQFTGEEGTENIIAGFQEGNSRENFTFYVDTRQKQ